MTSNQGKNTAASIRDRLLKLSRRRGEDFQLILTRYGMERLLYRLSRSESKTTSSNILEIAAAAYEEEGKKDDSLIEVLRDLSDFDLFWRHGSETPPMERVSNRTMLIDVHAMPVLKELVAYLVIERLYKARFSAPGYYRIEVQGQLGPY